MSPNQKTILAIANFIFMLPYCLMFTHILFIFKNLDQSLDFYLGIAIAIYAGLQVGGVWLISFISDGIIFKKSFISVVRIIGCLLFLIPNKLSIIISSIAFGLSQALFYRYTRTSVANIFAENTEEQEKAYLYLSVSNNIAFLILPIIGSYLLSNFNKNTIMTISLFFSLFGIYMLNYLNTNIFNAKKSLDTKKDSNYSIQTIILDSIYVGSFVIPYNAMMALVSFKTKNENSGINLNANLISLNAFVVLSMLLANIFRKKKQLNDLKLENNLKMISALAWILLLISIISPLHLMIPFFTIWSIVEAIQLPTLERHIFSERNYSNALLNRIFLIDAFGSFLGPTIITWIMA